MTAIPTSGFLFDPKSEYWNLPLLRSQRSQVGNTAAVTDEVVERPADQPLLTRRYTEEAISFVQKPHDGPFLLYVPSAMPHVPLFRGPDFVGVSDGGYYGDVIEEIDWSVGETRRALESQGLAENTLLVFTSDNGPWLSMAHHGGSAGPLNNGNGTTFDGGMRVPAIFWWPGSITPAVVSGIGSTMDDDVLLATLSFSAIAAGTDTLSVLGLFDDFFFGLFYETSGIDIDASTDITVRAAAVPEPGSVLLFSTGLFALLVLKRRERVRSSRLRQLNRRDSQWQTCGRCFSSRYAARGRFNRSVPSIHAGSLSQKP
jgi:hypothetical protein